MSVYYLPHTCNIFNGMCSWSCLSSISQNAATSKNDYTRYNTGLNHHVVAIPGPPLPYHIDNDDAQYVILRAVPRVVGPRPIYKHVQSRPLFLSSFPPSTMSTNVALLPILTTLNSPVPSISQAYTESSTLLSLTRCSCHQRCLSYPGQARY